eukprot:TRINITY_DN2633_c0_g1_i1.p2 TRINITY_DN2633_c0_g1~~TRINITY_DN2633_c0_g1_i1.p2  ORF type:complete len:72 (+),score=5.59 TRINITY_DN2633_c0_g1_i1:193-408(+)
MPKHEYSVEMTCEGCSGAVTRVLKKQGDKVTNFDINLDSKQVFVESSALSGEEILEILKKTGKATSYVGLA